MLKKHFDLRSVTINGSDITSWDTRLVAHLWKIQNLAKQYEVETVLQSFPRGIPRLLNLAETSRGRESAEPESLDETFLSKIGEVSLDVTTETVRMLDFIGALFIGLFNFLRGKARFRVSDVWFFLQDSGANALPIVSLISFLVGVIMAFVGAVQLTQFGAQIYVANLVGIAMTREMGALMTAIIITGRSGAAFAAQLGTMMVNQEIDALKTFGFEPMEYLVLPRFLALTIMLPPLALYADFLGIMGGALVGWAMLDLSFLQYFEQTRSALNPQHFLLGLLKAFIYGALVATAGCMRGLQSGRSASAVGKATTSAVVTGIVFIIVASAVTTYIYTVLGW
ncbi:MAG: ABC transporter permease [Calditrichaeota bacterium]|nr:ABC transporter permease [Calditrichota bacterium]RQW02273.1 MAG: ABC transporter permease [Calditrichota bacterium]